MPLPFFLVALFGKAAAGALGKGLASKAAAGGVKALAPHHGHHALARELAGKVAEQAIEKAAESRKERKKAKRAQH